MIRVRRPRGDSGFTLLELMVTMTLVGVLVAIAAAPYRSYQQAQDHLATTRKVVATLRNAQVRAVAEDSTYRVTIATDGRSWTRERLVSGTWREPLRFSADTHIVLRNAEFLQPDGARAAAVYFYPRGAATKGQLVVARESRSKTYTVTVEGLTARVSYS